MSIPRSLLLTRSARSYVGVQFHPEYLSRVLDPSRPYLGFVAASAGVLDDVIKQQLQASGAANGVNGESTHF